MSAIASFYILQGNDAGALISAAQVKPPERKLLGLIPTKSHDFKTEFRAKIKEVAQELEVYGFSGWVFLDLEGIYPGLLETDFDELGDELSKAMESSFVGFTQEAAEHALRLLGQSPPSDAAIQAHLDEEERDDELTEAREAIHAAWSALHSWLGQVGPGQLGLLSIG